jgi:hypothetical protein
MSPALRFVLPVALLDLLFEATILRIWEPISGWPGPDATAFVLLLPLKPFFEVLASDSRK